MRDTISKTNVMRILDQKKVKYIVHSYVDADAISGMDVANVLKQNPRQVFKTLVTVGDSGNNYVFLVPVSNELDMKKASAVVSEKKISMVSFKDLFKITGYIHGGCSPIGMNKTFETVIDQTATGFDSIIFSAGKIGYQVEISLMDLEKVIEFELADILL